jgi:hypothetical protein
MSTMADTPTRRKRRKFTDFKQRPARVVLEEGKTMAQVVSMKHEVDRLCLHVVRDPRWTPKTGH